MIEKLITSKTRVKLLELFLTHMDNRYYLRELERMLGESLSPLRRQLLKLEKLGILAIEYEANLKYYRLNRNFEGLEDLRGLVLGIAKEAQAPQESVIASAATQPRNDTEIEVLDSHLDKLGARSNTINEAQPALAGKRIRFDTMILAVVSVFVLVAAAFIAYAGFSVMKQVAKAPQNVISVAREIEEATRPDQMISRKWKVIMGNVPVFSSGETGKERANEL